MAVVTDYVHQLIAKQVDDRGIVVWYDPEQTYGAAAAELNLPNTTVARSDGSLPRNSIREEDPFAAHKAVCHAGESPAAGIGCLPA